MEHQDELQMSIEIVEKQSSFTESLTQAVDFFRQFFLYPFLHRETTTPPKATFYETSNTNKTKIM